LLPFAAGAIWALATPAPDLIVTGDGRHLALRTASGDLAILRGRAGDYVRSLLSETAGSKGELAELETRAEAWCNRDVCIADIGKGRRPLAAAGDAQPAHDRDRAAEPRLRGRGHRRQ
jgi:competence protein ComEC